MSDLNEGPNIHVLESSELNDNKKSTQKTAYHHRSQIHGRLVPNLRNGSLLVHVQPMLKMSTQRPILLG